MASATHWEDVRKEVLVILSSRSFTPYMFLDPTAFVGFLNGRAHAVIARPNFDMCRLQVHDVVTDALIVDIWRPDFTETMNMNYRTRNQLEPTALNDQEKPGVARTPGSSVHPRFSWPHSSCSPFVIDKLGL